MLDILKNSVPFILEAFIDLILLRSITGKSWRSLCTPRLWLLPVTGVLNEFFYEFFPNLFGWFIAIPICICVCAFILKKTPFSCIFPFLIIFTIYGVLEGVALLAMPKSLFVLTDYVVSVIGTAVTLLLSIGISFLPLHKLYMHIVKGNLVTRLVFSYIPILFLTTVAISKVDGIRALSMFPLIVTFMIILLAADLVLLHQQRTITAQQRDIENYHTYEPMTQNLISDLRGKQHDFNNQISAICMLPYTCKDYDSLVSAIESYSTHLKEEFNESELLKINLPVVSGFVFSKIKEAGQQKKSLTVTIKNRTLVTPVPEYDIIRMLGILIDNALDAVSAGDTAYLSLDSRDGHLLIATKNRGPELTAELRKKMFTQGFSTKISDTASHGLGLPNLKALVEKYDGKLFLENETVSGQTMLCFSLEL